MKTVSMKPVVQKPRKDGFWPVYIRFNYNGRCQFWRTSKVVPSKYVESKSEISDPFVLNYCSQLILEWMEKLNHVDYFLWNVKEIVDYATTNESLVSFSEYARLIKRLPKDIPIGDIVQFVVENLDKGGKWIYEHQKGKGFRL